MSKKKSLLPKLLNITDTLTYCQKHLPRKSFSEATLYRQVLKKAFPPPVKLGGINFWRKKEIDKWITKLVDGE